MYPAPRVHAYIKRMDERSSPCIRVCRLDEQDSVCLGCGRTLDEIAGWMAFNEGERRAVLARLRAERQLAATPSLECRHESD